jgi:exo-beta-1,3-glucanase (GH17 family)
MTCRLHFRLLACVAAALLVCKPALATEALSFFAYLQGGRPSLVAYVPNRFDPRLPSRGAWPTEMLRADLSALRPAFDGLVLYAFREEVTPAIVEQAVDLGYRAVLLGIWDPRSEVEIAGTAKLVRRWRDRLAVAVVIGNEGINDNRYDIDDLRAARERLRARLGTEGALLPVSTSEPAGDYGWPSLQGFGDFLAPNIHPAIDRADLDPGAAVAWVRGRAEAIARIARKPVLVKETGLPNGGAPSQSAERQRDFWVEWLSRGRLRTLDPQGAFVSYAAAFEAFDAPWKAEELGAPIEGRWGLMTVERRPYPAFDVWAAPDVIRPGVQ